MPIKDYKESMTWLTSISQLQTVLDDEQTRQDFRYYVEISDEKKKHEYLLLIDTWTNICKLGLPQPTPELETMAENFLQSRLFLKHF